MKLRLDAFKAPVFLTGCVVLSLLTGCSGLQMTTGADPILSPGSVAALSGATHGGYAGAIGGATITLYAAGTDFGVSNGSTAGMTTAPTALGTTTTDSTVTAGVAAATFGNWSFSSVTCPTANPNAQLYLVSRGGYSKSVAVAGSPTPNTAAVMMALVGKCSNLANSQHITINEETTVAAVYTMGQFMNFTLVGTTYIPQIGAPVDSVSTTYSSSYSNYTTGLNNAYLTYANLTNSNGDVITSFTPSGSILTMTGTPEAGKEALVANILASCVQEQTYVPANTTDGCGYFFDNTSAPPHTMVHTASGATVMTTALAANANADTLLATWYLVTNPNQGATNIANEILAVSKGTAAYSGADSTETDWTLGVGYALASSSSVCGLTSPSYQNGNGQSPFYNTYGVAVDAKGNIWAVNAPPTAVGTTVQVSSGGALLTCVDGTAAVGDGTSTINPGGSPLVIDLAGNVWYVAPGVNENSAAVTTGNNTAGYELAEYSTAGTLYSWPLPGENSTTAWTPTNILTDRSGNIYYNGYVTADYSLYEYTQAQIAAGASVATAPTLGTGQILTIGARAYDTGLSYISGAPYVFISGSGTMYDAAISGGTPPYTTTSLSTKTKYGYLAAESNGNMAGANINNSTTSPAPNSTWLEANATTAVDSAVFLGGLNSAGGIAVDGLNHFWASLQAYSTSVTSSTTTSYIFGIASAYNSGTVASPSWVGLSPAATGSACGSTSYMSCPVGGSFQHPAIAGAGFGAAVDPSGDLWIGVSTGVAGTSGLYELVGAAAPVVTPLAQH